MQKGDYITEEKRKELELEVEALKGPKRKEIIDALDFAKSLGDLSENAEYHQAREDQGKLEARILKIEAILKNSIVITNTGGDTISIGSSVTVQKENSDEQKTYIIVGAEEADMAKGKMSNHSPLGEALFGKKKGETITFKTPAGMVNYKIVEVK